jgi:formate-dependent nitrite reductase cytochrome c552 subunit
MTFKLKQEIPKEYQEQKSLAKYLDAKGVLWTANMSGARTSPKVWNTMKASGVKTGFPDILIFEPRWQFYGLAIELKRVDWKKPSTPREKEQEAILERFRKAGWKAEFIAGSKTAIELVERYLALPSINQDV